MNYTRDEYIREFMSEIRVGRRIKKKIKEDMIERIDLAMADDPFYNISLEMGEPKELAYDFMENLENRGIYVYSGLEFSAESKPYEFKSKTTIFGIPLVHINVGGYRGNSVAKGVIAIGDIAYGGIAVGGVCFGLISVGGIGIGVLALGGIAMGGFVVGGVAIGLGAIGGVAIGLLKAFGAVSYLLL